MNKTWEEFVKDINHLIEMMKGWRPDIIAPSMVGGLIPAGIVSEKLKVKDVRPISIERIGDERRLGYDIQGEISGKSVLLLEDDLPTGKGFIFAKKVLEKRGAKVKIAAVYVNSVSKSLADFYGDFLDPLPNLPWKPARSGDRVVSKRSVKPL